MEYASSQDMLADEHNSNNALIMNLPDEILEYILSLTSPYYDYKSALLVCHRWNNVMWGVIHQRQLQFYRAVCSGELVWNCHEPGAGPTITERYSHSACYCDRSLYVFGGCTATNTTFNDLWRFDLAQQCWIRPLATGTYPSPKACASLVTYNNSLVLFGGWSHPTPYMFHQASKFFNQLHVYDTHTNKWLHITTHNSPEGRAGHGASIVKDNMVVFGGYHGYRTSSNDVWVLDLIEMSWSCKQIVGTKPAPRYSHSQIVLDDCHILVLGGCGGPNMQLSDAWLLRMSDDVWSWQEMSILQPQFCPAQLWCHPACKVGDKVVVLSKNSKVVSSTTSAPVTPRQTPPRPVMAPAARGQVKRGYPDTSESSSQESSSDNDDSALGRMSAYGLAQLRLGMNARAVGSGIVGSGMVSTSPDCVELAASTDVDLGVVGDPCASKREHWGCNDTDRDVVVVDVNLQSVAGVNIYQQNVDVLVRTVCDDIVLNEGHTVCSGYNDSASCFDGVEMFKNNSSCSGNDTDTLNNVSVSVNPNQNCIVSSDDSTDVAIVAPSSEFVNCCTDEKSVNAVVNSTATAVVAAVGPLSGESFRTPDAASELPRRLMPSVRPNASKNRQRQLDTLKRYEEKFRAARAAPVNPADARQRPAVQVSPSPQRRSNPMYVHVLDVAEASTLGHVTWLPVRPQHGAAPDETIFHSLCAARGQLLTFGGIQGDLRTMQRGLGTTGAQAVTNKVYCLEAVDVLSKRRDR